MPQDVSLDEYMMRSIDKCLQLPSARLEMTCRKAFETWYESQKAFTEV
jgi:hypothetical protein